MTFPYEAGSAFLFSNSSGWEEIELKRDILLLVEVIFFLLQHDNVVKNPGDIEKYYDLELRKTIHFVIDVIDTIEGLISLYIMLIKQIMQ